MLRLTTHKGLSVSHLAKKAKKKIPMYEEKNAHSVNIPFVDEVLNKTRYLTFYKNDLGDWDILVLKTILFLLIYNFFLNPVL
jgi:hypothetical protein